MNILQRAKEPHANYFHILVVTLIIVLHITICGFIGFHRTYLFTDEVYSYGLSNSEHYSFCGPVENPTILNWTDSSFFRDYLQYDRSEPFSLHAAFLNQANDVHPPLYYCLLHIICYFFQNSWYSPIPGIILNLCLLPIIDLLILYIAKYFSSRRSTAYAALILWAFSCAGLSNAIFIRMYLLVTLWILTFVGYHIFLAKRHLFLKFSKDTILQYVPLSLLVAAGGLTHYYFYFFAAALGLCVCLYLLVCCRIKKFLVYGASLWLGLGIALLVFPSTVQHIFGYRGSYATDKLGSLDLTNLKTYFGYINDSLTGGLLGVLLIAILIVLLYRYVIHPSVRDVYFSDQGIKVTYAAMEKHELQKVRPSLFPIRSILLVMVIVATASFGYVSIQGSEIVDVRYIYPAYPLLAIFAVLFCFNIFVKSKISAQLFLLGTVAVSLFSVHVNGIDWTYSDYPAQIPGRNSLVGKDCVIVCKDNAWVNVLQAINVYGIADEVRCVYESQLDDINTILQERKSDDPVCFAFFSDAGYSDEDQHAIMQTIQADLHGSTVELSYDYLTKIYSIS